MLRFYWLALGILGTWRLTHLLQAEDGPWDLLVRFRRRAGSGFWGRLLDCFYCLSLWIAIPFAYGLATEWRERLLLWPALSAGAILLERATDRGHAAPSPFYVEDTENEHVVLRQAEGIVSRDSSDTPDC